MAFPEHNWDLASPQQRPRNYWKDSTNQRRFLLEIQRSLGIKEGDYEAWYKVSNRDLIRLGGKVLLNEHNSSRFSLYCKAFPEHEWDSSRFSKKPRDYWSSDETQKRVLFEIGAKLGISPENLDGWYEVTSNKFIASGGAVLLNYHGRSLSRLLETLIPDHQWDAMKFKRRPRDIQGDLIQGEETLHFRTSGT